MRGVLQASAPPSGRRLQTEADAVIHVRTFSCIFPCLCSSDVMRLRASASGHAPPGATPPRWRVHSYRHLSSSSLSRSDRGHHVPALTVTSGGVRTSYAPPSHAYLPFLRANTVFLPCAMQVVAVVLRLRVFASEAGFSEEICGLAAGPFVRNSQNTFQTHF